MNTIIVRLAAGDCCCCRRRRLPSPNVAQGRGYLDAVVMSPVTTTAVAFYISLSTGRYMIGQDGHSVDAESISRRMNGRGSELKLPEQLW